MLSNLATPNVAMDMIRYVFSVFDSVAYTLLTLMYQLFFNVASVEIFKSSTVSAIYGRIQLIIGVFMLFQLALTIIKGIVNPDTFTDSKNGAGNILTRIAVSLILLTLLVPINIPSPSNEYEEQINDSGLLFGTLYSLQNRLLTNNTLGKLILGTDDNGINYTSLDETGSTRLNYSSRVFSSTILRGFYRLNAVPATEDNPNPDPIENNEDRVCQDISDEFIDGYSKTDADPLFIIWSVNEKCSNSEVLDTISLVSPLIGAALSTFGGNQRYVIAYTPVLSTIVAIVLNVVLIAYTIQVAKRAIKLAVLRLIAPIPIISYMDPKGGKDSSFNAWLKSLSSTYLSLFSRLAIMYFVLFIVQDILVNGLTLWTNAGGIGGGVMNFYTVIFVIIGLFIFAKDAPKFIRQALGIKEEGGWLLSGMKEILGFGAVADGVVSGGISRANATDGNYAKKFGQGILGAIGGGVNAGKFFYSGKDVNPNAIMRHVHAYNTKQYRNAEDESTPTGRFIAGLQSNLGLKNNLQQMDDKIKYYNAANDALSRVNKAFDNNADYKVKFDSAFARKLAQTGSDKGFAYSFDERENLTDRQGNIILKSGHEYSLKDLNDIVSTYSSSSDGDMKDAVNEAKKQAQGMRFKEIRAIGGSSADRKRLVEWVNDENNTQWNENDLIAYDALHTIYDVADKYSSEAEFKNLRGKDFNDQNISWGQYKGAAAGAGRRAEQIKSSDEYAAAKANAERAKEDSNK